MRASDCLGQAKRADAVGKKVFISYSHTQIDWVSERLVPCLRAGGAEVLIDYEIFKAGRRVIGQMDLTQDRADISLLLISPEYLGSEYCQHEMHRAIARHQVSSEGTLIPVRSGECALPEPLSNLDLLYVDFRSDQAPAPWNFLLTSCDASLGVGAPEWLDARDDLRRYLERQQSVNLVITGHPRWRELVDGLRGDRLDDLGVVDLDSGATASRRGFVTEILRASGVVAPVPNPPEDLVTLDFQLKQRPFTRLVLKDFDRVAARNDYNIDLFASLRHLIMDARKLSVLIQSRRPFLSFLPQDHPLSSIDIKTVELRGNR